MVNFRYTILLAFLVSLARISTAQDGYWYKCFSGTIDKYPFTLHLHKMGHGYTGYYYYDKVQQPFYLMGDDTTAGPGNINLLSFVPLAQDNEILTISPKGDSLTGTWKKNATAAGAPVKAVVKVFPSLQFDFIYTSGSQTLRPKYPASPKTNFEAAAVWPRGNSAAVINLKKIINNAFGVKNSQQDIGQIFLANKKRAFAGYVEDNRSISDSEVLNMASLNYDEQQHLTVLYQSASILSLASFNYAYTGGAHGNHATGYISVNPATGKLIPLSGVLTPAGIKKLPGLLEKNFRKASNLAASLPLKEGGLFENKIKVNGNFFLTGTGIGFGYAPYEIGPYAMGEIVIFIPYADFGNGLNPGFKK